MWFSGNLDHRKYFRSLLFTTSLHNIDSSSKHVGQIRVEGPVFSLYASYWTLFDLTSNSCMLSVCKISSSSSKIMIVSKWSLCDTIPIESSARFMFKIVQKMVSICFINVPFTFIANRYWMIDYFLTIAIVLISSSDTCMYMWGI